MRKKKETDHVDTLKFLLLYNLYNIKKFDESNPIISKNVSPSKDK